MNVTKEADAAFMRELKRTDRPRYDRLEKAIRTAAHRSKQQDKPRCRHCGLFLPDDIRSDAKYCDAACKKAYQRANAPYTVPDKVQVVPKQGQHPCFMRLFARFSCKSACSGG